MRPCCCVLIAVSPDDGCTGRGGTVCAGLGGAGSGARSSCAQPNSIAQASAATRYNDGRDRGPHTGIADSCTLKPELYNDTTRTTGSTGSGGISYRSHFQREARAARTRASCGCTYSERPLPIASTTGCTMRQRLLRVGLRPSPIAPSAAKSGLGRIAATPDLLRRGRSDLGERKRPTQAQVGHAEMLPSRRSTCSAAGGLAAWSVPGLATRRPIGDRLLGRRVHLFRRQQHDGLRRSLS